MDGPGGIVHRNLERSGGGGHRPHRSECQPLPRKESINYDATPAKIAFDLGAGNETDVSYVRFYNMTDNVNGPFTCNLQSLNAGGSPGTDADWTNIAGTTTVMNTSFETGGQQLSFSPVHTRALRWVFTQDNSPGGTGNFRTSEFEFYTANQNTLNLANLPGSTLRWTNGTTTLDPVNAYEGNPGAPRFDAGNGPTTGDPQTVTLLTPDPVTIAHLRIMAEDNGQSIGQFSIEYLGVGGNPANSADWMSIAGLTGLTGQPNIADYNLPPNITSNGVRLNIANSSTNNGDHHLRLWQFEAFRVVPEPASLSLLALGGLALLRRRRGVV